MLKLIKDALDGKFEEALSNKQTGACTTEYEKARTNMTVIIGKVDPDELENFAFLKKMEDEEEILRLKELKDEKKK